MPEHDLALRAITEDNAFRVMTARTTETVRGAIAAQRAKGETARLFADLLTGAILVRETMSPDLRVQGVLEGSGGRLVADAHPRGETRGLVQLAKGAREVDLGRGGKLMMMRTFHDGTVQQGVVAAPRGGGVSAALMQYLQASEQVTSMIAVATVMKDGEVMAAGGYLVQLLPDAPRGTLMLMTERLDAFARLEDLLVRGEGSPATLMEELLYGMPHTQVGESTPSFRCQCSDERVAASLATLPRADIASLLEGGKVLEMSCDYCGKEYKVEPERLRGMLDAN